MDRKTSRKSQLVMKERKCDTYVKPYDGEAGLLYIRIDKAGPTRKLLYSMHVESTKATSGTQQDTKLCQLQMGLTNQGVKLAKQFFFLRFTSQIIQGIRLMKLLPRKFSHANVIGIIIESYEVGVVGCVGFMNILVCCIYPHIYSLSGQTLSTCKPT